MSKQNLCWSWQQLITPSRASCTVFSQPALGMAGSLHDITHQTCIKQYLARGRGEEKKKKLFWHMRKLNCLSRLQWCQNCHRKGQGSWPRGIGQGAGPPLFGSGEGLCWFGCPWKAQLKPPAKCMDWLAGGRDPAGLPGPSCWSWHWAGHCRVFPGKWHSWPGSGAWGHSPNEAEFQGYPLTQLREAGLNPAT